METGMERRAIAKHLDRASSAVIFLTLVLFVAALLVKGFTHDLFLETGVLLVSVKLILNTYHMEEHTRRLEERIDDVLSLMRTLAQARQGQFESPRG
jgi:accessory gene regulator protein AgrB